MKRLALRSIRTKLLVAFGVLALVPLATLGVLAIREASGGLERAAGAQLSQVADATSNVVQAYMAERVSDAPIFAMSPVAATGTPDEVSRLADRYLAVYPDYDLALVTDADGTVIATNTVTGAKKPVDPQAFVGRSMKGQAWFDAIASGQVPAGQVYVGDAELDPLLAQATQTTGQGLAMSIGIYDAGGKLVRVWSNHLPWDRSIGRLMDTAKKQISDSGIATAKVELVSKAGLVIDHEDHAQIFKANLAGTAYGKRVMAGDTGYVRAFDQLDGTEDVVGFSRVDGYEGYQGAGWGLLVHEEYAEVTASAHGLQKFALLVGLLSALFVVIGSFLVARGLTRPLIASVGTLRKVASGDLTARATITTADEVGQMNEALNQALDRVSVAFSAIGAGVVELSRSADELSNIGSSLSANADETSRQAGVVAAASEQAGKNVQTVAAGTEEMSVTIKEIAKNAASAARVATSAVGSAQRTNELVGKLGASSAEIGNVLKVITTIAEQTNLLALNATIEAARAGEAGKGFAVVANEVKELAKETAKATEDITRKISAIQADTTSAIDAIAEITQVIGQINDIQNTIASAVEEQAATTNEIGRNIHELAQASNEIAQNVTSVAASAGSTADASNLTRSAAGSLADLSTKLDAQVRQFHVTESRATSRSTVVTPPPGVHISQPIPVITRRAKSLTNGHLHH